MRPDISVIIPTRGRETLARTLRSIRAQADRASVEILVVEDTHSGVSPTARQTAEAFEARYFTHDAGHHCWGHCQINAMLGQATGCYVAFQDDDDIYAGGAFEALRVAATLCESPVPMMFQFRTRWGEVLWAEPRAVVKRIGGHCIVAPNVPDKLGRWGCRYEGDYDFIDSTLQHYLPANVLWVPRIIAVARPREEAC